MVYAKIFASTPEGPNSLVEEAGLYYRIKNNLDDLLGIMKTYKVIVGFDLPDAEKMWEMDMAMVDRLLLKFEKDNKISGEDMKIANDLYRRYKQNG